MGKAIGSVKMRQLLFPKQTICKQLHTGDEGHTTERTTGTFLNQIQFLSVGNEEERLWINKNGF